MDFDSMDSESSGKHVGIETVKDELLIHSSNGTSLVGGILFFIFGCIGAANQDATINMLKLDADFWMIENTGFNVLPYIEGVAIIMIFVGLILILSTILGIWGVVKMRELTAKMVGPFLLVMILAEIALIIYASVNSIYPQNALTSIQNGMKSSLESDFGTVSIANDGAISNNSNINANGWDYFQFQLQCCGSNGYHSFDTVWNYTIFDTTYSTHVPPSCCKTTDSTFSTNVTKYNHYEYCFEGHYEYIWNTSCSAVVQTMVYEYSLIAIITSSIIIGAQLVVISCAVAMLFRKEVLRPCY